MVEGKNKIIKVNLCDKYQKTVPIAKRYFLISEIIDINIQTWIEYHKRYWQTISYYQSFLPLYFSKIRKKQIQDHHPFQSNSQRIKNNLSPNYNGYQYPNRFLQETKNSLAHFLNRPIQHNYISHLPRRYQNLIVQ